VRLGRFTSNDWRWRFFRLNCFAFPMWIVFYRVLGGNISEFRLMWPVILPCIYGIAYSGSAASPNVDGSGIALESAILGRANSD
jgi:hypothetical protein